MQNMGVVYQEELMVTLNKIKAKLEKETLAHMEAKAHLMELTQQLNDLSQLVSTFPYHCLRTQNLSCLIW